MEEEISYSILGVSIGYHDAEEETLREDVFSQAEEFQRDIRKVQFSVSSPTSDVNTDVIR